MQVTSGAGCQTCLSLPDKALVRNGSIRHRETPRGRIQVTLLKVVVMEGSNTAHHIHEGLRDTVQQWSLVAEKQYLLATDNGANMVVALQAREMKEVRCIVHTLCLAFGEHMHA